MACNSCTCANKPAPMTVKLDALMYGTRFFHENREYQTSFREAIRDTEIVCHPVVGGLVQTRIPVKLAANLEVQI